MAQVIKKQMDEGVDSRRVGFVSTGAPARQHSKIFTEEGEEVAPVVQQNLIDIVEFSY